MAEKITSRDGAEVVAWFFVCALLGVCLGALYLVLPYLSH